MLNEAACIGFFPNRKLGTRRAPSIDNLSIRSCFGTDPFEEIKDQRLNWVWHKCINSLARHLPFSASDTNGAAVLREWRAREKILRRHRRDSGLIVSVEVSGSRTGYALFIITPKCRHFDQLLEVKIADPRAPVETAVRTIVFGGVPEGAVVHRINGH